MKDDSPFDDGGERSGGFLETVQKDQASLSKSLRRIKDGGETELLFDRRTGRLFVGNAGNKKLSKDVIPATKMAKEGFFGQG